MSIQTYHILLLGGRGTGKTTWINTIAKLQNCEEFAYKNKYWFEITTSNGIAEFFITEVNNRYALIDGCKYEFALIFTSVNTDVRHMNVNAWIQYLEKICFTGSIFDYAMKEDHAEFPGGVSARTGYNLYKPVLDVIQSRMGITTLIKPDKIRP